MTFDFSLRKLLAVALLLSPFVAHAADDEKAKQWGVIEKYCFDCHNTTDWAGGIAFDTMSMDDVPAEAETWEKAIRRLRGRLMPPPGKPQPCIRVQWLVPAARVLVNGQPVLLQTSTGLCLSPEGHDLAAWVVDSSPSLTLTVEEDPSARAAYLEPWEAFAPRDQILADVEDVLALRYLLRAVTWDRLVDLDAAFAASVEERVALFLRG